MNYKDKYKIPDSFYIKTVEEDKKNGLNPTYSKQFMEKYQRALKNEIERKNNIKWVESDTVKNKTIHEIEVFLTKEYDGLIQKQENIRSKREDYLDSMTYAAYYGEVNFISKLSEFLDKIKDYEEE